VSSDPLLIIFILILPAIALEDRLSVLTEIQKSIDSLIPQDPSAIAYVIPAYFPPCQPLHHELQRVDLLLLKPQGRNLAYSQLELKSNPSVVRIGMLVKIPKAFGHGFLEGPECHLNHLEIMIGLTKDSPKVLQPFEQLSNQGGSTFDQQFLNDVV